VGDVTNRIALTPVAIREGAAVAMTLFGGVETPVDLDDVPSAVFSQPPVGTVGFTEAKAVEKLGKVDIYKASFRPLHHTLSGRDERTLVKLVVDAATQRVVGAHMVGADAPEISRVGTGSRAHQGEPTPRGDHPGAEEFGTWGKTSPGEVNRRRIANKFSRCATVTSVDNGEFSVLQILVALQDDPSGVSAGSTTTTDLYVRGQGAGGVRAVTSTPTKVLVRTAGGGFYHDGEPGYHRSGSQAGDPLDATRSSRVHEAARSPETLRLGLERRLGEFALGDAEGSARRARFRRADWQRTSAE
jgi:hypothetical protein